MGTTWFALDQNRPPDRCRSPNCTNRGSSDRSHSHDDLRPRLDAGGVWCRRNLCSRILPLSRGFSACLDWRPVEVKQSPIAGRRNFGQPCFDHHLLRITQRCDHLRRSASKRRGLRSPHQRIGSSFRIRFDRRNEAAPLISTALPTPSSTNTCSKCK